MTPSRLRSLACGALIASAALFGVLAAAHADAPGTLLVYPPSAHNDKPALVTVTGTDMLEVGDARLQRAGRPDIVATGLIATPTTIVASFDITDDSPGPWDLVVTNPDGSQTCDRCFTVTADPPAGPTPEPAGLPRGTAAGDVTLRGSSIFPGADVSFAEPGITLGSLTYVDTDELRATIAIAPGAALGPGSITVTNTDGQSSTCADCFTVISSPLATGTAPSSLGRGAVARAVSIAGSGFADGATVGISGAGAGVVSASRASESEMRVLVSVSQAAPLGARDIVVTNPDGGTTTCATCLTVAPAPAPMIVTPGARAQGAALEAVSVIGEGFAGTPEVSFGPGISVSSVTLQDQTRLDLTLSVALGAATGARDVVVTNPDGGTGVCAGCFVVGENPTVLAAVPGSRGVGASGQDIEISGAHFADGATVSFSGEGVPVASVSFVDDGALIAHADVVPDAAPGARTITVTNPDGGIGRCVSCFRVNPLPSIASISPARVSRGSTLEVLVNGADFAPDAALSFGEPVTVESATVEATSRIRALVSIPEGTSLGALDAWVDNGDGGAPAACAGCLTIVSTPTVGGVLPEARGQGATGETIELSGTGLLPGATVSFSGGGIDVRSAEVASPTSMLLRIDVAPDALPDARAITVTNPDGEAAGCGACFVVNAAPSIAGVEPGSLPAGSAARTIALTGAGFQPGSTVEVGGTDVTAATAFVDPTRLDLTIDVDRAAPTGARAITVTNPDGGAPATCATCFAVTPRIQLTSVSPSSRGQGATDQTLTLEGTGFEDGTTVEVSGPGVSTSTASIGETTITVLVAVEPDAAPGARDVTVTAPDGLSATCAGCFTVNPAPQIARVSPPVVGQGTSGMTVLLRGNAFQPGADLWFSGDGVVARRISRIDGETIEVVVDAAPAARAGARSVSVRNPDGGTTATCAGCVVVSAITQQADFDGDGFDDVAIGAPGHRIGGHRGAGSVTVVYGTAAGSSRIALWNRDVAGIAGRARTGDAFGAAVATGDFDMDGFTDLAAGAPGARGGVGAIHVLYGSADGLGAARSRLWEPGRSGLAGSRLVRAAFGTSLAAGDLDGDGFQDLAIGSPADRGVRRGPTGGSITVMYGSGDGLTQARARRWHRDIRGVRGVATNRTRFGWAVASGDFDRDGFADVSIGAPGQRLEGKPDAGAVNVIYGSPAGLTVKRNRVWHREKPGIVGIARAGAAFGSALASGDLNGDGFADLAIGAPGDVVSRRAGAGSVSVLFGRRGGLGDAGDQLWNRDVAAIHGASGRGDRFGASLATGRIDGDRYADLVIGVPGDGFSGLESAGAVTILYGSASGPAEAGNELWTRDVAGVPGRAATGDLFGSSVAVVDFSGDGFSDVVVGAPLDDLGRLVDSGSTTMLRGSAGGVTPIGSLFWRPRFGADTFFGAL